MKRKYYLRGLGFGILITAIVFCIAGPSEMTDAEIIERAIELGYVKAEEDVSPTINLKDLMTGTPAPSPELTVTPVPVQEPEATSVPQEEPEVTTAPQETGAPAPTEEAEVTETPQITTTEEPEETSVPTEEAQITAAPMVTPAPTETPVPTEKPQPTETPAPTEAPEPTVITAQIVVERGNTATVVCDKIEAAGIMEDGSRLRTYLINNNLTDYINIGTYTLSSDMSLEEIASILTGQ